MTHASISRLSARALIGLTAVCTGATTIVAQQPLVMQRVTFTSDGNTLVGYLFKPEGNGPFPAVIWNHGSEKNPAPERQFRGAAGVFVPAGYVTLAVVRRGHGESGGDYIQDVIQKERQAKGPQASEKLFVQLMEGEQLRDQLAGAAYLKTLPYVDANRLVVAGCSYGGIQTLLGAASAGAYKAAVSISPGAESWNGHQQIQQMLIRAVDRTNIPVLIIHPEDDANVAPGYALGQELQRLHKPYALHVYPPFGTAAEHGHCFGGAQGMHIWAADAIQFLHDALR